MCKNNLKHICPISVTFAIRASILLNSVAPFLCPQSRSYYLAVYHSPDLILFCLSLNLYSKSISGKEPCRLTRRLINESCGKHILPTFLVRMQTCMQLLFSVQIQEHHYPKLRRAFTLSSLFRKSVTFPCLTFKL